MQLTAGVIVILAFGLGIVEALRAYLRGTRFGGIVMGRLQAARASDRVDRFGEARTIASATAAPAAPFPARTEIAPPLAEGPTDAPDERDDVPSTLAAAARIVEGFGSSLGSPSVLRVETIDDLAEFARNSRSGDLWMRVSDFDSWPERGERRDALIEAIAAHPEWDDRAVYQAGIALAIWDDDGAFGVNRARNRKRVRRLRAAASRDLVYLEEVRAARDDASHNEASHGDAARGEAPRDGHTAA